MGDEWEVAPECEVPGKKVIQFFKGEGDPNFVKEADLTVTVEYAKSLKAVIEDAKGKYEECSKKIKTALGCDHPETMPEKKIVKDYDGNKVILTKKQGRATIDWEQFAKDLIGTKDLNALMIAKEARSENKYIKYGEESVSLEIV